MPVVRGECFQLTCNGLNGTGDAVWEIGHAECWAACGGTWWRVNWVYWRLGNCSEKRHLQRDKERKDEMYHGALSRAPFRESEEVPWVPLQGNGIDPPED